MNTPLHLLRLQLDSQHHENETLQVARPTDVQWGAPIFRAPTLPTPHQLTSDLPFTVNARGKFRQHAG